MGDLVPRHVRQITVLVHQNPRYLLEEATAGGTPPIRSVDLTAAENSRRGGGGPWMLMDIALRVAAIPTLPWFVVE